MRNLYLIYLICVYLQHVGVADTPKQLYLLPSSDDRNFSFGLHPNHVIFVVGRTYYRIICINTYASEHAGDNILLHMEFDHERFVLPGMFVV